MKGLIIKDFLVLKQNGKVYLFMLAGYTIYSFLMKDLSMISVMIALWSFMANLSAFSYDEKAKWDLFILSTSITRKQLVLSKYIFALLLCGVGAVVTLPLNIANVLVNSIDMLNMIYLLLAVCGISYFLSALLYPLIFKFGVEKARSFMIVIFMIPMLAPLLMNSLGIHIAIDSAQLNFLPIVASVALVIVSLISYQISCHIMLNKDM